MTVSLQKLGLLTAVLLVSMSVHAEYYLVYTADPANTVYGCTSCATSCCNSCCSSGLVMERVYRDTWRSNLNHKKNHYTIDEITNVRVITEVVPVVHRRGKIVEMEYGGGPRRAHYVNMANNPYDPDMATGDDEIMVDSDMNNQY